MNYQLQREVRQLHDEKEKLVYILNMHIPTCTVTDDDDDDGDVQDIKNTEDGAEDDDDDEDENSSPK